MTKDAYIEYWQQWLSRAAPEVKTRVVGQSGGMLRVERWGHVQYATPVPCECHHPQCLGWQMHVASAAVN